MLLKPPRIAPRGRPMPEPEAQDAIPRKFGPPIRGWVTNENISEAGSGGALVLDNFVPMANTLRARGGHRLYATASSDLPIETLMSWRSGRAVRIFAASGSDVRDITDITNTAVVPASVVTDLDSADLSWVNYSTPGGEFLVFVNGVNKMRYFDGDVWRQIDAASLELPYDTQTANFTTGTRVTGRVSEAEGTIVTDEDNGTDGTLRLRNVDGEFADNELVRGSGGSARVNIPDGATAVPSINDVSTTNFSHVWVYKSRLFFLKRHSLIAYALNNTDSLGGNLTTINLGAVMTKGGSLIVGATISTSDAGSGPDDYCVFISDQGECAIYQGSDPSNALLWKLVGVYPIGRLLHKNAVMRAGGNLLVATETGLVPITNSMSKDVASLSDNAVSLPIEPTWKDYVAERMGKWTIGKWTAKNMALVGFPTGDDGTKANFVLNLQTGAWARWTGFTIASAVEVDGHLYVGTDDGLVLDCETAGDDNGAEYNCLYVGLHESIAGGSLVQTHMLRATWRYFSTFKYRTAMAVNYSYDEIEALLSEPTGTGGIWDSGRWDVAVWGGFGSQQIATEWASTAGNGHVVSPIVALKIDGGVIPKIELVSLELTYTPGALVA